MCYEGKWKLEGPPMESFFEVYREKTPLSWTIFQRAREVMPGGISHNIHYFPPYPFIVKEAIGPKLIDVDGNEYIDLWMGNYTHILGHRPQLITQAIEKQLKNGIHWGALFEKQIEWAELIQEIIPSAEMIRFCCSGTEATMYAVRVARAFTGKKIILKIAGGWHGANSDLTVGIKMPYEKEESLGLLPELQLYTKTIPFNDLAETRHIIEQNKKDLAGIILEPVIAEGGFSPATPEYLRMLRSETEKLGALLIFDEVISGFRVALGGAQERFGVLPDLTTLGKIAGGGMPVGVVVGKKEILIQTSPELKKEKGNRILIGGGTFSAHPLTVAAGLAMLQHLKEKEKEIYPSLERAGEMLRRKLQETFDREGLEAVVTGFSSLYQVHFPFKKGLELNSPHHIHQFTNIEKREVEFRIRMLTQGVHVMHGGGALSTAHTDEDIERIVKAARKVAKEMVQS